MSPPDDRDLADRFARIEAQVDALGRLENPEARAIARDLAQTLLDFHARGLARLMERVDRLTDGPQMLSVACAEDDLIGGLLLLHGLHPLDVATRLRRAIEAIRPSVQAEGGDVDLLGVAGTVARVRMREGGGGLRGWGPSAARAMIEAALLSASPEITEVEFVEVPARPSTSQGWVSATALTDQAATMTRGGSSA